MDVYGSPGVVGGKNAPGGKSNVMVLVVSLKVQFTVMKTEGVFGSLSLSTKTKANILAPLSVRLAREGGTFKVTLFVVGH